MSAQVQRYAIWAAALIVVLIAIALVRGKTSVKVPVEMGS
jgi:hypothetical protein